MREAWLDFIDGCNWQNLLQCDYWAIPPWPKTIGFYDYLGPYMRPFQKKSVNPNGTGVFLGQSWTGGGVDINPPLVSRPWGIWQTGAQNDFCDDFSEDYFEVHNISVAQKLTILETIMRFWWKCHEIRTRF